MGKDRDQSKVCLNCEHYLRDQNRPPIPNIGECRIIPPVIMACPVDGMLKTLFPKVDPLWWCGQFELHSRHHV